MCLVLIALDAHPRYPLIIAANRDEFHARAAAPAHWRWQDILAGEDRVAGGTWFGVTRRGRWALVTNFREGVPRDPDAPSRGGLVILALTYPAQSLVCAAAIARAGNPYHGFNLLVGDGATRLAAYASNRASGAIALETGIHGLSNHLLDTPWPKLVRTRTKMAEALAHDAAHQPPDAAMPHALLEILADRTPADDASLPATGLSPQWERLLSSPFIVSAEYGTRCSTVLVIERGGRARFIERSFDARGEATGQVEEEFSLAAA